MVRKDKRRKSEEPRQLFGMRAVEIGKNRDRRSRNSQQETGRTAGYRPVLPVFCCAPSGNLFGNRVAKNYGKNMLLAFIGTCFALQSNSIGRYFTELNGLAPLFAGHVWSGTGIRINFSTCKFPR
ncbi:hypothetical protein Y032_0008g372 [Ancylostoma ceylanicum]|uniref:Uncharacterized protein n=1 Tax=Ancylostoma ceylanicum TaxID=53326 RepID=A0A016VKN7_9BILA|nr:hypothetical protein Y032_0008g372 [Ancylostoma ceylanicum]